MSRLARALEKLPEWLEAWRGSERLILLLDFDGTLAPIVDRPELARIHPRSRHALERLLGRPDVQIAIVTGRTVADARERVGLRGIFYAGNHGLEIEGPGVHRVHDAARAARPVLDQIARRLGERLGGVPGSTVEDKGLTLSVHHRLVAEPHRSRVLREVEAAAAGRNEISVTRGKMVLEIGPRVDWHKGRAVDFILARFAPPAGAPVLYFGDDRTDEDAFRALASRGRDGWAGVVVAEVPPTESAASAWTGSPDEVAALLERLARSTVDPTAGTYEGGGALVPRPHSRPDRAI